MKKYVITSWIPKADINSECLNTLAYYAKVNNAKLMVGQCAPNYVIDLVDPVELTIQDELSSVFTSGDVKLNNNLLVTGYRPSINVIDPLQGLESIAASKGCLLVPYPRQRFKMVPRMLKDNKAPRAMWCTGTISEPLYRASKTGVRMKEYHTLGAIVVEIIDGDRFNVRQLQFDGEGIYDLTNYYTSNSVIKGMSPTAVVLADDHATFINKSALSATKKMLQTLKPQKVFHHDTLDCMSISHHTEGKNITRAMINMTLETELKITSSYLRDVMSCTTADHHLVASNHLEHLDRYLDEGRYMKEPFNHKIGLQLALAKINGEVAVSAGLRMFNKLDRLRVHTRHESMKLHGIEMLCHGDFGANGMRGSPRDVGLTYNGKVISGHTHQPSIEPMGNIVVGTLTDLTLPYTNPSGGSSWMHSHVIVYPNGKFTHFHILPE